ncbi:STAS domain-containing protein [Streptomyces sp. NPDC055952]|uniref:STAS domain-containing protein n=1 Tax=Streptomyces sp. NPDC055952 TaxID=3345663 RepID=UPI0035E3B72E
MSASFESTKVHVTHLDQVVCVAVRGELDFEDAEDVAAAWTAADRSGLPTTAVDLSRVAFADSMLLNALLDARRRHEATGRTFVLLGPLNAPVSRLLEVTGTLGHFTVQNSTSPNSTYSH